MWYWISDRMDGAMQAAAKQFGEALEVSKRPSTDAELLFLEKENELPIGHTGRCIAVGTSLGEAPDCVFAVREPFDRTMLVRIAKTLCGRPVQESEASAAEACLDALGVPRHLLGYRYLAMAVNAIESDPFPMRTSVMRDTYPTIAAAYGTTPAMVNRAIRHAIDTAWRKGNTNVQRSYFGYASTDKKGVPTNAEFLYAVLERLRLLTGK